MDFWKFFLHRSPQYHQLIPFDVLVNFHWPLGTPRIVLKIRADSAPPRDFETFLTPVTNRVNDASPIDSLGVFLELVRKINW